jgi:sugar phosphate isomerase/epimerase
MDRKTIAAQLYTLRDYLKTPPEIAKSLKKVRKTGFKAVQVSGMGPIPEKELKEILEGEGLVCCATHEPGQMILENTSKVIDRLHALGCKHTAYPWPHTKPESEADYIKLAKDLSEAGKKFAEAGLTLSYHNHAIEFQRFGKRLGLEIIYEESDPKYLLAELDTYWIQHGGGNPATWCKKLPGRMPLIHLKEYGIIKNEVKMLEIGNGNLNWKKIITSAKNSGTEWFIIEQDLCRVNPFESLEISLEYLSELEV